MAIDKDGIKHACLQCIRGHRVKKCNHQERQLVPLLKRGRQVSQCNHCRELRSSGSHVKCTCATSTVPNPLNGCLCEIVQICTCVARHLQDTQATAKSKRSSSTVQINPSPIESEGIATTAITSSEVHDDTSTTDPKSLIITALSSSLPGQLSASNLDQDDFLLPSASIQTPPLEAMSNHHSCSSSNMVHDISSQWITTNTAFDDNQYHSVPTSIGTTMDTPDIDALDLFLHQDMHDLLSL